MRNQSVTAGSKQWLTSLTAIRSQVTKVCVTYIYFLVIARIRRMAKVLFSQVSVCPHLEGGYLSQVLSQVTGTRSFLGSTLVQARSKPGKDKVPPSQDWGITRHRTAEQALATSQVVCLIYEGGLSTKSPKVREIQEILDPRGWQQFMGISLCTGPKVMKKLSTSHEGYGTERFSCPH